MQNPCAGAHKEKPAERVREMDKIFVTRSSMPRLEDYVEEIRPIFESHILTNMGPVYKKFQRQLIDYLEVPYLSLFVNGHMALEMAIQAMGLQREGGEVITTPFTFVSTVHAISRNHLTPVFCDIRLPDYTMDPEKIEALINEKTVAIIPVHVYGNICDVEAIGRIAEKHKLKVIYDAAHAFGERYRGVPVGNFGDAAMFSFHATKVFNSIEGGAVAFRDERYRERLHELKNFGIHGPEEVPAIGGNAKLDEFRAAMGICNLKRMEECIAARKSVFERYFERLGGVGGLTLPPIEPDTQSNYSYFPVLIDKALFGMDRDEVFELLRENNIFTRKYFYPAVNDMDCYRHLKGAETPVARAVSRNILTLPIYEELKAEDVDRICDVLLRK